MPNDTLQHLLDSLIDYAGLFPPAQLPMDDAVAAYAAHRTSDQVWMLGRFIVPVGRLDEFETAAAMHLPRDADTPWALSVLVGADLAAARARIDAFNAHHASPANGAAAIEAIEAKATTADEIHAIAAAFGDLERYVELRHDVDPTPLMRALAATASAAKIRTGGVTADAFPTPAEVARFLLAAADTEVTLKATAGLHHPLRGEYRLTYAPDSPDGTMFGFLNVFLAAAFARHGALGQTELEALLEEREPSAIVFDDDGVRWRDHRLSADHVRAARGSAISYGSCSFDEPVADLQDLTLL